MSQVKAKQIEGVHADQLLDNKYDAITDPTVTDDINSGYKQGSVWINTTATPNRAFICVDNTLNNAVWEPILNSNLATKDPTGFDTPANVVITANGDRTITLTGTFSAYWRGSLVPALTTGYTSPAHANDTAQKHYLFYDGSTIAWSTSPWTFDKLQIAVGFYDLVNAQWVYIRECHGLMPFEAHKEFHNVIGTYKSAGGTLSNYTLQSTTAANRRPDLSSTTINDEDVPTVNATLTSKLYTKYYLSSSVTANFTVETADIIPLLVDNPYYNLFTGGNWTQSLMPANSLASVWVYAVPTCSDTTSQKYRYIFIQPQWITQAISGSAGSISSALATELTRTPSELTLGEFATLATEFIAIGRIVVTYTASNWRLESVTALTGTRYSQIGSPAGNYISIGSNGFVNSISVGDQNLNSGTIAGVSFTCENSTWVDDNKATTAELGIHRSDNTTATTGSVFYGCRQRGTFASPLIVANGDNLLDIVALGYDGADFAQAARIDLEVDGVPGTNDMPGRILFRTSGDGSQSPTERMRISQDGNVKVANLAISSMVVTDSNGNFSTAALPAAANYLKSLNDTRVSFSGADLTVKGCANVEGVNVNYNSTVTVSGAAGWRYAVSDSSGTITVETIPVAEQTQSNTQVGTPTPVFDETKKGYYSTVNTTKRIIAIGYFNGTNILEVIAYGNGTKKNDDFWYSNDVGVYVTTNNARLQYTAAFTRIRGTNVTIADNGIGTDDTKGLRITANANGFIKINANFTISTTAVSNDIVIALNKNATVYLTYLNRIANGIAQTTNNRFTIKIPVTSGDYFTFVLSIAGGSPSVRIESPIVLFEEY